jgi:hypothetical protein
MLKRQAEASTRFNATVDRAYEDLRWFSFMIDRLQEMVTCGYGPWGLPLPPKVPPQLRRVSADEAVAALLNVAHISSVQNRLIALEKEGYVIAKVEE